MGDELLENTKYGYQANLRAIRILGIKGLRSGCLTPTRRSKPPKRDFCVFSSFSQLWQSYRKCKRSAKQGKSYFDDQRSHPENEGRAGLNFFKNLVGKQVLHDNLNGLGLLLDAKFLSLLEKLCIRS